MNEEKRLVTIKKAHEETGVSISFFKNLLRDKKLKRYKLNSITLINLVEFYNTPKIG